MNINSLKEEFLAYLEKKNKLTGADIQNAEDINIFEYSSEFKSFLKTQDDIDLNRSGLKINELVDTLDESGDGDIIKALESAKADLDEDGANAVDFLTFMLEDEEFSSAIDADGKNGVDKSELVTFLSSISKNDKDKTDVTLRDLIDGGREITSGHYKMPEVKNWDKIVETKGTKKAEEAESSSSSGGAGGSGGVSGGGGITSSSTGSTEETTVTSKEVIQEAQKNYEGKTVDELETLKTEQLNAFDEQEKALQAAIQGNSQEVATQKKTMDDSYQQFLDICSAEKELVETATRQKEELQATEVEANTVYVTKEDTQYQKDGVDLQITQTEQSIETVSTNITSLEGQISQLEAAQSAQDPDSEDKVDYSSQIAALQSQVQQLTQQKTELETQKNNLETESENLQKTIEELDTQYQELVTTFNTQSEALAQTEITLVTKVEESANAYNTYSQNKATYEQANSQVITNAQVSRNAARANIEAIETQIIVAKGQETKAQIDQFNSDFAAGNYEPYIKPKTDEEEIA